MASMRLAVATGLAALALTSFAHAAPAPAIRDVVAEALRARASAPADVDATAAALVDRAAADPKQADEAAAALLLLDRNDAALDVLTAAGRNVDAFAMLVAGMRHADALALPVDAGDTDLALLRARTLATVGRRDEAAALLREVGAGRDGIRAVREASLLGMNDDAMSLALGLAERGRLRELTAALWPSRRLEAETALSWLQRAEPAPTGGDALLRLREILDPAQASADADALLKGGAAATASATSCEQARAAYGLIGLAERRRQPEVAMRYAREWAASAGTPQAWATLGDMLRDRHQWIEAAAAYAKAADMSPGDGAARFMQSLMMRKLADPKAADALLARAEAEAATPCALARLASTMEAAGEGASARRVRERTAEGASDALQAAASATTPRAIDRARALALRKPLTVSRVLPIVRAAQASEIRALTQARDFDALMALSAHAIDAFVSGIDETADAVSALRSAGRGADADALLSLVSERIARAAEAFPESAHLLNARAWLGARARTDLAASREAAEHAVSLRPDDPALLDTLAEVRFQQGDRAGALEAERRALAIDTDRPYLERQVARFTSADPSTPPQL